jgi:hypothetical protein
VPIYPTIRKQDPLTPRFHHAEKRSLKPSVVKVKHEVKGLDQQSQRSEVEVKKQKHKTPLLMLCRKEGRLKRNMSCMPVVQERKTSSNCHTGVAGCSNENVIVVGLSGVAAEEVALGL